MRKWDDNQVVLNAFFGNIINLIIKSTAMFCEQKISYNNQTLDRSSCFEIGKYYQTVASHIYTC